MTAGRPLKWTDPKAVELLAAEYFTKQELDGKPITITGLAYHLDTTRQTLCDYQAKDEFTDTINRIKLRVEMFAEEKLFASSATGAIFALKNHGWKDTQDLNHGGQKDNPMRFATPDDDAIIARYIQSQQKVKPNENE